MPIERIRCASIVLSLLGLGFLISGIVLIALTESIIKKAVIKECQLKQGTVLYQLWRDSPVPFSIAFYVFDLVNEHEFLQGDKPHLIQRGPFVYNEQRSKQDVKFYPNETISYRELRNYTFDRSRSSADETLLINTINVVYMTLMNYLQSKSIPGPIRQIIERILSVSEPVTMQRTVREYLWGYEDPLLKTLKGFLPKLVTDDQVSVFASVVNEAQYETLLINNGVGLDANHHERVAHVGDIERFNFSSNLSIWSNSYANMINGTDSTLWHPDVKRDKLLFAFINDICRSIHLKYDQTRQNSFGITNYRYVLPDDIFANSSDNEGFCEKETLINGTELLKCLPNGLFSLSPCIHLSGSSLGIPLPIIASNPHFLHADRAVQTAVEGLSPDEVLHRSFLDIEPITGVVMNGSRRMQFNINVVNDSKIKTLALLKPLVYPMIWIEEYAEIDKTNADMFHSKVFTPLTVLAVVKYIFLGVGIALLVTVIGLMVYTRYQRNDRMLFVPVNAADETTPLVE